VKVRGGEGKGKGRELLNGANVCVLHVHFAEKCRGKNDEKGSNVVLKKLEKIYNYIP
jgi:hypothetical protein